MASAGKSNEKASQNALPKRSAAGLAHDEQPIWRTAPLLPKQTRRGLVQGVCRAACAAGFALLGATGGLWAAAVARFMLPNAAGEARRRLKIGKPHDFPPGTVDGRFRETHGLWIVHGQYAGKWQIAALSARCTHLGCMVRWQDDAGCFRCPCHGSSFSRAGLNLSGPARGRWSGTPCGLRRTAVWKWISGAHSKRNLGNGPIRPALWPNSGRARRKGRVVMRVSVRV